MDTYIERVTVLEDAVELKLAPTPREARAAQSARTVSLPWSKQPTVAVKGVAHEPTAAVRTDPKARDTALVAIGKARLWLEKILAGRSFAEIAKREGRASVRSGCWCPWRSHRPQRRAV